MSTIERLQNWYVSQCNDDWEHTYGINIGTIDNPGWSLIIDLTDTDIQSKEYDGYSYGIGEDAESSGNNWLTTKIEKNQFVCYGGPHKLDEMINIFLDWATSDSHT